MLYGHQYLCGSFLVNSGLWVPQNRLRFYVVAIRQSLLPSGFDMSTLQPVPRLCLPVTFHAVVSWATSIGDLHWVHVSKLRADGNAVFRRNLAFVQERGRALIRTSDIEPNFIVGDMHASPIRMHCVIDEFMCLTKSRAESDRMWIFKGPHLDYGAKIGLLTMARLQGWTSAECQHMRVLLNDKVLK